MIIIFIFIGIAVSVALWKIYLEMKVDALRALTYQETQSKVFTKEQQAEFYFSCLCNALVLFAASPDYLFSLAGPVFNPVTELESEFDYAFRGVIFEQNFENGKVPESLRNDLLLFKQKVDAIPNEIWTEDEIETHAIWQAMRIEADDLLKKLGITRRNFNFDFTNIIEA